MNLTPVTGCLLGVLLLAGPLAAQPLQYDFSAGTDGWVLPAGAGVVSEPGQQGNQVLRLVASEPHHTRAMLVDSAAHPNFLARFRVRMVENTGAPANIFVYGRHDGSKFRYIGLSGHRVAVQAWFNRERNSPTLGQVELAHSTRDGQWYQVAWACWQDFSFAKVWREGEPEPPWQIRGATDGLTGGQFGIGVWLSPQQASGATLLVDDVLFRPLAEADLAGLGLRVEPRRPLPAGVVPPADGRFRTADLVGLRVGDTALALDRRSGELAHLVHLPSGREFVAPETPRPLFTLRLTQPAADRADTLTAELFGRVECSETATGGWRLTFTRPTRGELVAIATIEPDQAAAAVSFRLRVSGAGEWAVAEATYPDFAQPARLAPESKGDQLILPWSGGALLPDPGQASQSRSMGYPGISFVQFTARYDDTAGCYLAARDPDGHCKRWELATAAGRFVAMPLAHQQPELVGADFELPYDVVLRTFAGDWYDAADLYKSWAVDQPWCRRPLTERDDIPAFLKQGCAILIMGVPHHSRGWGPFGEDYETLLPTLAEYKRRAGLRHVVFVPYGWENRGTWAGINYLPANPSDAIWERIAAELRETDDRLAFLTSGYWWVVRRQETSNGPAFDDSEQFAALTDWTVQRADGRPWFVDNYADTKTGQTWRGYSVKLCHGSAESAAHLKDQFLRIARLGVPLVSFDQEIGGGQGAGCYHPDHGHPPGWGNWHWTAWRDLCADLLAEGKAIDPEFGLFVENVSELAIPYMATYWSRQFGEIDHGATGGRGIGLFNYLYHEYVTTIGAALVQGQGGKQLPAVPLRIKVMANCLTRGLIPGPFMQQVRIAPENPWQEAVSQAFFSFARPYSQYPEYLLLGAMRRPPEVDCAEIETVVKDAAGNERPLSLPAVSAGSFQAADGSVGTILVNGAGQPEAARISLRFVAPTALSLRRADGTVIREWVAPAGPAVVELAFEAYEPLMLIQR